MSDTVPPMPPQENPGLPSDLEATPYPSLAVMRETHRLLLRTFRAEGNTEEFAAAVLDFVIQGSATGVVLDVEDDRWAAQNMIDYWATMLYRWGYEGFDAELDDYDFDYAPELLDSACPYLGLNAYDEAQHNQFFGRERLVSQALEKINNYRFAAVLGLSGSGKSSLVIAGIIPALKRGNPSQGGDTQTPVPGLPIGSADWLYMPPIVPSDDPLKNLATVLLSEEAAGQALAHQIRALRNDNSALLMALDQLAAAVGTSKTAVLFIDEFEELFTICKDEEIRDRYVANLLTVLNDPNSSHVIILAMHSDYEGLFAAWPEMMQKLKSATVRVTPPSAAELRDVIVKPAQNVGLRFEEGLVERLLQDVSGEQVALPLLQFTLLRLWDYRDRNRITWDAYNHVGGGRGSLLTAVNNFYRNLSKQERALAKKIFLKFVIPYEDRIELLRVTRKSLYQLDEEPDRVQELLDKLLEARLIRITKEEEFEEDQFDLVHPALAQDWAQYVEWLEEARAEQYELLRLRTAAQQWRDSGRETSRLRRGELLQTSLLYLRTEVIGPLEREFLQESIRAEEQQRKEEHAALEREEELKDKLIDEQTRANSRLRTFVGILTMAAIVAVLSSVIALTQRNRAVAQAEIAATSEGAALEQAEIAATSESNALNARTTAEAARAEALAQANAAATAESDAVSAQATSDAARADALAKAIAAATAEADARASADEARQQANIARSGRLAVQGFGLRLEESDLSLLLALQAINLADTLEARSSLLGILQGLSQQVSLVRHFVIEGHEERVFAAAFSPDGQVLASGGYDNRVFFWDVVTGQQIGQPLERHEGWVRRVVFSEDGTLLATAGYDNHTILWDVTNIAEPVFLSELNGHSDAVNAVTFIPTTNPTTGRFLATGSRDKTIVLWDITNPRRPVRLSTPQGGHTDKVYTMVVTPDGRTLISAGADQQILFWNISNPGRPSRPVRILEDHEAEINALAISHDGRYLASGDDAGVILLWDVNTGQRLGSLLGHSNWILGLDFDPSGQYLASSSRDGSIFLWDVESFSRLSGPFNLHQDWVWDVAFNLDGTQLVSAGRDGRVILWDVKRNPQLATTVAMSEQFPVTAVSFPTADTVRIATGPTISTLPAGQDAEAESQVTLEITPAQQGTLLLSAEGRWAAAYEGLQLLLWDVSQGGAPLLLGEHSGPIRDIAFSADGQRLASVGCSYNNATTPIPVDPETVNNTSGQEAQEEATPTPFFAFAVPICTQSEIRVWDMERQQAVGDPIIADELELVSIALDHTGDWIASGGCARLTSQPEQGDTSQDAADKNICLDGVALSWELADNTAELRQRFSASQGQFAPLDFVRTLAFSPDRDLLVTGSDEGTLLFWNADTGQPLGTPQNAHSGQLNTLAFNPEGSMLASTGNDALVVLWDVASRQPLASELRGHENGVLALQFSPDGNSLVTGGVDGRAIVWRASLESWQLLACQIAGRDLTASEWSQYVGNDITQRPVCEFDK